MGSTAQVAINLKRALSNKYSAIDYSFISTPFGVEMFLASSPEGVLFLGFGKTALHEAKEEFRGADFRECRCKYSHLMERYFKGESIDIDVVIFGSDFKFNVLKTLIDVAPYAELITYSCLAESVNNIKGVRAVASAIAGNPVSLLIPCHRVVRKGGEYGKYRWGVELKRAIVEYERLSR